VSAFAANRGLLGASAVVFAASAITTVRWCGSMASMPGMEMPGGWTMSMACMRMPGQTWLGAAATFIGMWVVMMVAMMLPVLVPALVRYRAAVNCAAGARLAGLTTIVGVAYFAVWTLCGVAAFAMGVVLAEIAMWVPAVSTAMPVAAGVVVATAGILQFTAWKTRELTHCRTVRPREYTANAGVAWRHGLRLGFHCLQCCAGLTAVLLVIGVMDLRAMAIVTALIAAERLAPVGLRTAQAIGALTIAGAIWLIAPEIESLIR
jgi:predicted metal-binding membrane protein